MCDDKHLDTDKQGRTWIRVEARELCEGDTFVLSRTGFDIPQFHKIVVNDCGELRWKVAGGSGVVCGFFEKYAWKLCDPDTVTDNQGRTWTKVKSRDLREGDTFVFYNTNTEDWCHHRIIRHYGELRYRHSSGYHYKVWAEHVWRLCEPDARDKYDGDIEIGTRVTVKGYVNHTTTVRSKPFICVEDGRSGMAVLVSAHPDDRHVRVWLDDIEVAEHKFRVLRIGDDCVFSKHRSIGEAIASAKLHRHRTKQDFRVEGPDGRVHFTTEPPAKTLRGAALDVVAAWERGHLDEAVRELDRALKNS